MAKRRSKKQRTPNLSPLSVLRPRLDALWREPPSATGSEAETFAKLDGMTRNTQAADFLPILVPAYALVQDDVDAAWGGQLRGWLDERGHLDALAELAEQLSLDPAAQQVALGWLSESGVDTAQLDLERPPSFFDGYWGGDEFDSQSFLIVLWYVNAQRSRVQGINFLIDNNPPWEGAIKDALLLPQRSARDALAEFVAPWRQQSAYFEQLGAAEAKQHFLKALAQNQSEQIRLSRDTAALSEQIQEHIFSLPDADDAPDLAFDDFEALTRSGKAAEEIRTFEQTVGRRVRMGDGKELVTMDSLSSLDLGSPRPLNEDEGEDEGEA